MAELYQVYGGSPYGGFNEEEEEERPVVKRQKQQAPQVQQQPEIQLQAQQQSASSTGPSVASKDGFYNGNGTHQNNNKESFQNYRREYTFWDRMSLKRAEVIKLAIFSLVIVLAIALDRISTHYISRYLSDNILTNFQELMLRLAYPIVVFLLLWIIKAL